MTEVVMGVDLSQLGQPHESLGGMLEVRFTNANGATEVWMVPNENGPNSILGEYDASVLGVIREHVKLAYLDSGVDSRIGLLMKQAEGAREHIGAHHDELETLYRREFGVDYHCQQYVAKTDAPPEA